MPAHLLRALVRLSCIGAAAVAALCIVTAQLVVLAPAAAAAAAPINTAPTALGIAESNLYFMTVTELATAMQAFEQMGVKRIRIFLPWRAIEPNRGAYNWAIADRILDAAAAKGIGVVGAVTSTPIWASRNGFWLPNAAPDDPNTYAQFMVRLAERYGAGSAQPRIAAYEIWNELQRQHRLVTATERRRIHPTPQTGLYRHQGRRTRCHCGGWCAGRRAVLRHLDHQPGQLSDPDVRRRRTGLLRRPVLPPLQLLQ